MHSFVRYRSGLVAILVVLSIGAAGCGSEEDAHSKNSAENTSQQGPGTQDPRFECQPGLQCDSATQYCLISKKGKAIFTSACEKLPDPCHGCPCAQSDAPRHFPTSNNCKGWVLCDQRNSRISVTCLVP